ncbi:MAG: DUF2306 domain-containing protein [Planctomycetes bacterium]|nr:DUF2306 domain-containing protein [Planctomycetota bacterium]
MAMATLAGNARTWAHGATRRNVRAIGRGLGFAAVGGLTALLLSNVLPYFGAGADDMPFLHEKGALAIDPVWRTVFDLHVAGGALCLVVALPLFSRQLLRRHPGWHRALGWTYVLSVLVLVAPTGLWLAPTAKGGFAGQSGFAVTGLYLFGTTALGLREVLRRDFVAHRAWMVRSYALAASALSFRVLFVALEIARVPHAYVIGVWASFGLDLVVAELVIGRAVRRPQPSRSPS